MTIVPDSAIKRIQSGGGPVMQVVGVLVREVSRPAGLVLVLSGLLSFGYLVFETIRLPRVPRERMYVVLILTFFSMLFWSFFEQAGSSVNNFTDRNVDRVAEAATISEADVGRTIEFRVDPAPRDKTRMALPLLSQEQLGHRSGSAALNSRIAEAIRSEEQRKDPQERKTGQDIDKLVLGVTQNGALTLSGLTYLRAAAGREGARWGSSRSSGS